MVIQTKEAQLYIGGVLTPANMELSANDFILQEWTPIGKVEKVTSLGDVAAEYRYVTLSENREVLLKGVKNAGRATFTCGLLQDDVGQTELFAAEGTTDYHAFRIVYPISREERFFVARVMRANYLVDGANSVVGVDFDLSLGSRLIRAPLTVLDPGKFTNTNIFYAPTVIAGNVTVQPGLVTNTNTFYSPSVQNADSAALVSWARLEYGEAASVLVSWASLTYAD